MTSDAGPLPKLGDLAEYELRPLRATVPGVARIDVQGGLVEEYRVTIDPARLAARGLSPADVATALSAANVLSAVGQVEDHYRLYLVATDTRVKSIQDLGTAVIRPAAGGGV